MRMAARALALVGITAMAAVAQDADISTKELMGMDIEALLTMPVEIATGSKAASLLEAPGIVTVITREEILALGARDLFDLLIMVPGLDFGLDVWSLVGLGVRGNWASEGKALLLIDGIEMNERLYMTLQFINHYHLQNVERIEIIRGPGSALYGGSAELAVVNVISRKPAQIRGMLLNGAVSMMDETFGGAGGGVALGWQSGDVGFSLDGYYGNRTRSTRDYTDIYGDSYSLADNGDLTSVFFNVGFQWRDLEFRAIVDRYEQLEMDGYDAIYAEPATVKYHTYAGKLSYDWKLGEELLLSPWVSLAYQRPWNEEYVPEENGVQSPYTRTVRTVRGGLTASWDPIERMNLLAGFEGIYDNARSEVIDAYGDDEFFLFYNGSLEYSQWLLSAYLQGLFDLKVLNLTAGARYQYSPEFGSAIAPRGALTRDFGRFHLKLLASGAYKSPGIENVNSNRAGIDNGMTDLEELVPERTWVAEFEAGGQLTKHMSLTANAFLNSIADPIVYLVEYPDSLSVDYIDGYGNYGRTGTWGVEAEYQVKYPIWWARLGYSYQQAYENEVEYFASDDELTMAGWPSHKVTCAASVSLLDKKLSITPSVVWTSGRYAYTGYDDVEGVSTMEQMDPITLINCNVRYAFPFGLSVSLAGHNLLDDGMYLVQPYDGYHAPMSSSSRTFTLSLTYDVKAKGSN